MNKDIKEKLRASPRHTGLSSWIFYLFGFGFGFLLLFVLIFVFETGTHTSD